MIGETAVPYRVAAGAAEAELKERGSRFLAVVRAASDERGARALVEELRERFPDATHHCFAWRLGHPARERSSDDGEPAGTAGAPMLRVLRGADLSDVVAVVTRWFGGTKLGKGGLARAYSGALDLALARLPTASRVPIVRVRVEVPFERLGAIKALVRPPEITLEEEEYADEEPWLVLRLARRSLPELAERLAAIGCRWTLSDGG
ncbi:MAG: YigZ family protein [Thermoanaerobaculia bacterium]